MHSRILLFVLLLTLLPSLLTEAAHFDHHKAVPAKRLRVMWWNVENLFDTLHDEGFDDHEFLPTSPRRWNSFRYWKKQGAVAKTLLATSGVQPVDLVGLTEVENDSVLQHLCRHTRLTRLGYEYIITHSHDLRGIDVALLYQPEIFQLIAHGERFVPYDSVRERPTRPLLWASGKLPTGDTLDVIVAHFPSRRGGEKITAPYRHRAATCAIDIIDSLQAHRQRPQLLMMGDFNDEPHSATLRQDLSQRLQLVSANALPHPQSTQGKIDGTYVFQQQWSRIDHILVSPQLLDGNAPLHTSPENCHIAAFPALLEVLHETFVQPKRLYRGPIYHGGVSDHLPLFLDLWY